MNAAEAQSATTTTTTPPVRASLALRSQSPWVLPDEPFTFGLGIQSPSPERLELAIGIYRRIPTRSDFALTLNGRIAGRPVTEIAPVAVTDLAIDAEGDRSFSFDPGLTREGVYPLKVELRPIGGGRAIDSFVTYLTRIAATVEEPKLEVALVVPVHAPPAIQPDGRTAIDDQRAEEVAGLTASLGRSPDLPLTLLPTPETVQGLATSPREADQATATALADVAAAAGSREVLGGGYVPTNLTAMIRGGLGNEQTAQIARGVRTVRELLKVEPTTTTRIIDERLDADALSFLQAGAYPVTRLVIPEALLEPIARDKTLVAPFEIEGRSGRIPAAMADTELAAHFGGRDPVLAAYRLLADLAVLYFDDPGQARGVVAAPPSSWQPSGVFVQHVLGGLTNNPILGPVTVGRLFADVPPAVGPAPARSVRPGTSRTLLRRIAPTAPGAPTPTLPGPSIRNARSRIDSFATSLVQPANPLLDRLDRTLLAGEAAELRARDRSLYLSGVQDQIAAQVAGIAMPDNRSITLTAREGEIPVTVTSTLDYPVKVVLRFSSDTLEFPEGNVRILEVNRRNTTARISVRATSSGSFPLRVLLETPDGSVTLADSRFTVRSTAVSGVGTGLSIGALLFLLVWWGNHLRGRRSRKLVPAG